MRKKILIFSLAYFPRHFGGAEVAIKEITDRISDIEFHLITLRFDANLPREEKIGNVHVHRIGFGLSGLTTAQSHKRYFYPSKILFLPLAALKGIALHRTLHFDGLWAMMTYMLFPVVFMRFFGVRIPYVLTLQEGDPFTHVYRRFYIRPFLPLIRHGFRHAASIQAISHFLGAWASKLGYAGDIAFVPNGVAFEHFAHVPESIVNETKDKLGKKMGDVLLVTTSRLVYKNAVDDVIRALAQLPFNVHFLVIGIGPEETKLKKLSAELNVVDRVQFLGQIGNRDLPEYLHASDIFVRASRSEGMGISFVEAMAAGVPVIATQEGGIADFLFDPDRKAQSASYGAGEKGNDESGANLLQYKTGWAVDKDSPDQIARAIEDIISRPERVRTVIATAREMVKEKYNWDLIARDMRQKVFERVTTI